jgi:hypothetical protein
MNEILIKKEKKSEDNESANTSFSGKDGSHLPQGNF